MSFSLTQITISPREPLNRNDSIIQISEKLFTELQLNNNRDLKITLGKKTIITTIQIVECAANEMLLPKNIIKAFCLPIQSYKFQAIYHLESQELQLGPVIGLLTDFPIMKNGEPHFRSIHTFCEELHHGITERGGFFYVFPYDKFLEQGYYFVNGKWTTAELPLPDVIYNRIHSRRLERWEPYKHFRKRLDQLMIPLFNDRFLSKWEVYEHVHKENQLFPFMPETKVFSKEHLHDFAQKYETIFVKPIHGSQGRNIVKVTKEAENCYSMQSSLPNQANDLRKNYSLEEIYQQIKPILHNRIYIIQQGILLAAHQSAAMDFRVLCHKNLNNDWEVTSTVARIAAEQEFVSNLARGGTLVKPLHALRTCMSPKKALEVLALMKELALETASVISRRTAGLTGELGIDIGVDQDGKPWLIEVNSKPSKSFEDGLGKIRPSAKAIIQFCTIIAFDSTIIEGGNIH
ncbi:YheC/YheD family endospore coat-associated protein [Neobacillus soli]|uniref:YheC/YheD family endospore coat-associated protein n=1 Tax=Neobacillus soli TaxID=220688 RepID=UPI0008264507|nr:YheC/YheD family protein [Neobacillus soli]